MTAEVELSVKCLQNSFILREVDLNFTHSVGLKLEAFERHPSAFISKSLLTYWHCHVTDCWWEVTLYTSCHKYCIRSVGYNLYIPQGGRWGEAMLISVAEKREFERYKLHPRMLMLQRNLTSNHLLI